MTDPTVADVVYLEPLTVEAVEAVIARERPDGLLAGLGGQTALNLAVALARAGVLERHGVRLIGTPLEAIEMAEDRELFRALLDRIGQPYAPSWIVEGATPSGARRVGRCRAARDRPARRSSARVHARRHRRRHRRDGAGIPRAGPGRASGRARSARSWSSAASSAGRRSSTRSCATPTTRASPSARWRTSTRSGSTPATRSSWRRSRRCPTRSTSGCAAPPLAIIRALGVEGGCNVQFALSPGLRGLRGHRGQPAGQPLVGAGQQGDRLPDRPGRGPDRRRAGGWPRSRTWSPARRSPPSSRRSTTWSSSCRASRSTSSRPPTARWAAR